MISKPEIQSIGDVFELRWVDEKIHIKVDHLHESAQGLYAEITASKNSGDSLQHLQHARINLLTVSAKKGLARQLSDRVEADWDTIIEQTCVNVLRQYRKGEPVMEVGNLPKHTKARYRLYPYILNNEITAIYGMGGSGKSYFVVYLALCVQCGHGFFGIDPIQGNVLILDWEASPYVADERVKALKEGMGISVEGLPFYRRCSHLLRDDVQEIQRIVLEHQIKVVVIDSVGMASGFDDYHNSAVSMLRALRSLGIACVCIDHMPKAGGSMFGSTYKVLEARSVFELQGIQTPGESNLDIALFHRKINDGRIVKPVSYHVEFTGDNEVTSSVVIKKQDVQDVAEFAKQTALKEQIVDLLKVGSMPLLEIVDSLMISESVAKSVLYRNKKSFIKIGDDEWGLLGEGS